MRYIIDTSGDRWNEVRPGVFHLASVEDPADYTFGEIESYWGIDQVTEDTEDSVPVDSGVEADPRLESPLATLADLIDLERTIMHNHSAVIQSIDGLTETLADVRDRASSEIGELTRETAEYQRAIADAAELVSQDTAPTAELLRELVTFQQKNNRRIFYAVIASTTGIILLAGRIFGVIPTINLFG